MSISGSRWQAIEKLLRKPISGLWCSPYTGCGCAPRPELGSLATFFNSLRGLALIGVVTLALAEGQPLRKLVISLGYLFIGLRMGLGALKMRHSEYSQTEFSRHQHQRLR